MQDEKLTNKENTMATASSLNFGVSGFIARLFSGANYFDGTNIIVNAGGYMNHKNDWFENIIFTNGY